MVFGHVGPPVFPECLQRKAQTLCWNDIPPTPSVRFCVRTFMLDTTEKSKDILDVNLQSADFYFPSISDQMAPNHWVILI